MPTATIPGIPVARQRLLEKLFATQPHLQSVWLFGSRAMGRHQPGSDLDLCLEGPQLSHQDRLRLMAAIDDLLLPWKLDLVLRHQLPPELLAHVDRVGRCIWRQPASHQLTATPRMARNAKPGLREGN